VLRFGTDGVRGVALTELTPQYVASLGAAAARVLGSGTWLIGRDTRQSGPTLEAALVQGLRSAGALVVRCGVVPTPALAHFSATHRSPAAMITASHNAFSDNGVKVFAAGGTKLSDDVEQQIEAQLEAGLLFVDDAELGAAALDADSGVSDVDSLIDGYVQHVVELFPAAALAGLRVVIDCANGAMSVAAPAALRALGADVVVTNAEPNGTNINAGCGATHTAPLARAVVRHGAHAGLALDGDGDRVIAIDDAGNVVDGDRLIALSALQLQAEGELTDDTVVVTVMSNIGFHRAMRDAGITVVTTAVGDRYVLEALDAGNYSIGGEQSGHVIYRHVATTGDGLLAGLKLLQRVHDSHEPLSAMAAAVMRSYPQVLVNVTVKERHPDIADELCDEIAVAADELGGDGRVLVRPSGTEPLIRVMVEAATDQQAADVAARLADVVRSRFA
jgi:phosphoglucosamine mutase